MSLHMIIGIGVFLAVVGIVGSAILAFKSVTKAIKILFFRQSGIQIIETNEDRKAARKILKWALGIIIVIGMVLSIPSMILLYAPRGFDSLLSQRTEGVHTGDDDEEMQQEGGQSDETRTSDDKQNTDILTVEGRTVYFDGRSFEDLEELGVYLPKASSTNSLLL